ncbi:hypothetical protein [Escherichia coli]|uniref:hypothetical protein n=1 Tax=Escherichia coli TaxID=562 RepID=UPI000DF46263|nr:hypothetical protein [Escherichia coli]RDA55165.1 hypothetical protein DTQ12_19485 [Escherichia coli]
MMKEVNTMIQPLPHFVAEAINQEKPEIPDHTEYVLSEDLSHTCRRFRGFRKAFSFEPVIKTPFDLLKHLAVWQLQVSNKKSKGGPNGGRKELSAHPLEL